MSFCILPQELLISIFVDLPIEIIVDRCCRSKHLYDNIYLNNIFWRLYYVSFYKPEIFDDDCDYCRVMAIEKHKLDIIQYRECYNSKTNKMYGCTNRNFIDEFKHLYKKYKHEFYGTVKFDIVFTNSCKDICYYILNNTVLDERLSRIYMEYTLKDGNLDLTMFLSKYVPYKTTGDSMAINYNPFICYAAQGGNVECAKFILDKYKSINVWHHPINLSVKYGNYNMFQYLKSLNKDYNNATLVELCVEHNHLYILQSILEDGYCNYDQLLKYSIQFDNLKTAKIAIDLGGKLILDKNDKYISISMTELLNNNGFNLSYDQAFINQFRLFVDWGYNKSYIEKDLFDMLNENPDKYNISSLTWCKICILVDNFNDFKSCLRQCKDNIEDIASYVYDSNYVIEFNYIKHIIENGAMVSLQTYKYISEHCNSYDNEEIEYVILHHNDINELLEYEMQKEYPSITMIEVLLDHGADNSIYQKYMHKINDTSYDFKEVISNDEY